MNIHTNTKPLTKARLTPERSTRQRSAILAALKQASRPLSTQEILEATSEHGGAVGIATIYRNLKSFMQSGEVTLVEIPGDSPRYEIAGHSHHHHFHCTSCDRVFDVHHCPGNLASMAPEGFRVESHELILYGKCSNCCR